MDESIAQSFGAPIVAARAVVSDRAAAGTRYIVSPGYDLVFFILSPLIALGLGIVISLEHLSSIKISVFGHNGSPTDIFIGAFTMSHLFIVFFRSHGNRKIFEHHPARFTLVPIALLSFMCASRWLAVAMGVLATWWDVYHSSLQTFGLGRIYDQRRGNDALVGRRLDYLLNLLLYAGPILAGASLTLHTKDFHDFDQVDPIFSVRLGDFGDRMNAHAAGLRMIILGVGIPFLLYYLWSYWRYFREGYRISWQKVALMAATGFCSVYTWGFNSFGEAFFIMNFFHAFQYWGLVWWSEKKTLTKSFGLEKFVGGRVVTLLLFLTAGLGYGLWAEVTDDRLAPATFGIGWKFLDRADLAFNAIIVVALMHFWYDGFIWSVRKRQI